MPTTYYPYVGRAGTLKLGAAGAAEAACTDSGSVLKSVFGVTKDVIDAPIEALGGVPGDSTYDTEKAVLKYTEQSISSGNVQRAFGSEIDASSNPYSSGTNRTVTYFALYLDGFKIDGETKKLHIPKCRFKPSSEIGQNKEAVNLEFEIEPVGDSTMPYLWSFLDDTADTTAPTATIVPADDATNVAKAAATTVVWTFDEAIQSTDVTSDNFEVFGPGARKAGTLGIDATYQIVTFTPGAAWDATTAYTAVAHNVRDLAGNEMTEMVTNFTTGS